MKLQAIAAVALVGAALSGCASIVGGGSSQDIQVSTFPAGASCVFVRHGEKIGMITSTPGTLNVKRRKYDIEITCNKPGYEQASFLNHSGLNSLVAGNVAADLILTVGISSIVDSANGADNEYTSPVNIGLSPLGSGAPPTKTLVIPKD